MKIVRRISFFVFSIFFAIAAVAQIQTPEQFFGFRMGADKKLARWDKIVEYMQHVANASDRVRFHNVGPTTLGNPFVLMEISSPENLKNLDQLKALERKLYFQGGAPTDAERDQIFQNGKAVVLITNNIHSTEIGSSQMVNELVYQLATDTSPRTKKILDNNIARRRTRPFRCCLMRCIGRWSNSANSAATAVATDVAFDDDPKTLQ